MKKWIYCFLVASLGLCGCSSEESNTSADTSPAPQSSSTERQAANQSAKVESPQLQPVKLTGQTAATEPKADSTEVDILSDDLRKLLEPLAEGECFFSAPTGRKVQVEVKGEAKESGTKRDSIRLLGFVQVESNEPKKSQAILRINGKLNYVCEGDQLDDLEVLSIAAPVITFQQQRQRWSISLHDQPASQASSQGRFVSTRPAQRPARPSTQPRSSASAPAAANAQPQTTLPGGLSLPVLPGLPELPSLPGISPNGSNDPNQPNSAGPAGGPSEPAGPQLPTLPQLPDLPGGPELPKLPDELNKDNL
ncbi:MAG TPA: hypothetical protein DCF63_02055 [Planctomycetaceae bacterium]|nr:hypothetical protein [Planctomycetaceae bacterium]